MLDVENTMHRCSNCGVLIDTDEDLCDFCLQQSIKEESFDINKEEGK